VIVNASVLGCHALIVTDVDPGIQVVELNMTLDEAIEQANSILGVQQREYGPKLPFLQREQDRHSVFECLEWLWSVVSQPVLNALGYTSTPGDSEQWPRVWWCPTGPLTVLPLHAAGIHPRNAIGQPRLVDIVPGRVISSYTPTLAALSRARRSSQRRQIRQLAVGMPHTPHHKPLPAVETELAVLAKYLRPPEFAEHLLPPRATRKAVLTDLPDYPWVHLACHGGQNYVDPSRSAFALNDGPLTIADLAALRINDADFAYLSACQTAAGDTRLPDEAVHLAAAMQLIGYRHVIATMWTVADSPSPEVADAVYSQLVVSGQPDAAEAAKALHVAITALRQRFADNPLIWAPYIHLGA
jgi:CHAT domain-containing protein